MGVKKPLAYTTLAVILSGLWAPLSAAAGDSAAFDQKLKAAVAAVNAASSVGGEWRDTGKLIKDAEAAANAGDYDQAIKLAEEAHRQGQLGYQQAMSQKNAGLPDYLK